MLVMALLRGSARRADTLRSPGRTACGDCRSAGAGRCTGCGQGERVDPNTVPGLSRWWHYGHVTVPLRGSSSNPVCAESPHGKPGRLDARGARLAADDQHQPSVVYERQPSQPSRSGAGH